MQRIHGLTISATIDLPGIEHVPISPPDVCIRVVGRLVEPKPPMTERYVVQSSPTKPPEVRITSDERGLMSFRYGDGTAFDVDLSTTPASIDAVVAPEETIEDMCAYLYGPVLGYVLRARGILALHASAVAIDGRAVLFGGASGAGKSTTAAALVQRGATPVSDDLTAITPNATGFVAHRAFDHFRLWAPSESLLFGRSDVLDRITPRWDKRRFPARSEATTPSTHPVGVIYLLDWAEDADLRIDGMGGADALLSLTTNTYANYLLDTAQRSTELTQLGTLVSRCAVRRVTRGPGHSMDEICDHLRHDLGRLSEIGSP